MTIENCGRTVTIDKPPQRVLALQAEAPRWLLHNCAPRAYRRTRIDQRDQDPAAHRGSSGVRSHAGDPPHVPCSPDSSAALDNIGTDNRAGAHPGAGQHLRRCQKRVFEVNIEELIAKNPDVVILGHASSDPEKVKQQFLGIAGINRTQAVRNDQILAIR